MLTRGVHALHPQGVQEGVQIPCFVRGPRGARNPTVAPCQFLPATNESCARARDARPPGSFRGALCVFGAGLRLVPAVHQFAGASLAEPSAPGHPPVDRGSSPCPPPQERGVLADGGGITGRILPLGSLPPRRLRPVRIPSPHATQPDGA